MFVQNVFVHDHTFTYIIYMISGGLTEQGEDSDKLSNPELRKARFDILYKEYEVGYIDYIVLLL